MFDMSAFIGKFIEEARERLQKLNAGILTLETAPGDVEVIKEVMREAHTLKGSSKMMGLDNINQVAHRMEDLMVLIKDGKMSITAGIIDILFESMDAMSNLVEKEAAKDDRVIDIGPICARLTAALEGKVEAPAPKREKAPKPEEFVPAAVATEIIPSDEAPPGAAASSPSSPIATEKQAPAATRKPPEETVRVGLEKINLMANLSAELVTDTIRATNIGEALNNIVRRFSKFVKGQPAGNGGTHEGENLLHLILSDLKVVVDDQADFALHITQVGGELRNHVMGIRMLPVSTVFDTYPRAVRDLARQTGKEVEFIIEGGETSLDKRVIEEIGDPLIHLIRNSVDHGIEPPDKREAAGKPRKGRVRLSASQRGDRILIRLEDDGGGIDPAVIRQVAVRKNFLTEEEVARLNDEEAIHLIFQPGFSSKSAVSDISGRGVGMDVVSSTVNRLGGLIHVSSEVGKGSRFTLELPLTVAVLRVLLIRSAGHLFAVPLAAIHRIVALDNKDIVSVEGRELFYYENQATLLGHLSEILGLQSKRPKTRSKRSVLVLRGENEKLAGLVIDFAVNEEEVVIKDLGDYLDRVDNVSAATILSSGDVVMILDMPEIFRQITGQKAVSPGDSSVDAMAAARRVILVVEDSFMVRELEKDILEAAGYDVVTAIDGLDACEKLHQRTFDLVLTDVEMPRMSGVELTKKIRENEDWQNLRVIVVTSLDQAEDMKKGMDAGADAYIVKKEFDQTSLLETVRRLIH